MEESIFGFLSKYKNYINIFRKEINLDTDIVSKCNALSRHLIESDVHPHVVKILIHRLRSDFQLKDLNENFNLCIKKILQIAFGKGKSLEPKQKELDVVKLFGLHGSGKTTFCGKLDFLLKQKNPNLRIGFVSLDFQREAGQEQLKDIADQSKCFFIQTNPNLSSAENLFKATDLAKRFFLDVLICDTPGCNFEDEKNREQVNLISSTDGLSLFVVDGMMGIRSYEISKLASSCINIDGVVVTKVVNKSMIGTILNSRFGSRKSILYICNKESFNGIREYNSCDFIDVFLEKEIFSTVKEKASLKTNRFTNFYVLRDFLIKTISPTNMNLLNSKITDRKNKKLKSMALEKFIISQIAIIDSMTKEEKNNPYILDGGRRDRIAKGSGSSIEQVELLCNQIFSK